MYREQYEREVNNAEYGYSTQIEGYENAMILQYKDYVTRFEDTEEAIYYVAVDFSAYIVVVKKLLGI